MRLLSLYVKSFGKLRDFSYEFTEGFNEIKEDNGFGKTTLAAFIKAMFYGYANNKKTDIDQNDFKHYRPFNTTVKFGGWLRFEYKGRTFRVERYFGNTQKEHTLELFDESQGKKANLTENDKSGLGMRLFGIDGDAFERCLYLPQRDVVVENNDSFVSKLSNLAENTTDKNNFQKASKALSDFCRNFKLLKGEGGSLSDLSRQKEEKKRQLEESNASKRIIDSLNGQIITITQELEKADAIKQKTENELTRVEKELTKFAAAPSAQRIEEQIKEKEREKRAIRAQAEQIKMPEEPKRHVPTETVSKAGKGVSALIIIAVVLAVVGIVISFFAWFVGVPMTAVGAVLAVVWFVGRKKAEKREKEEEEKRQREYEEAERNYLEKLNAAKAKAAELKTRIAAIEISEKDLTEQLAEIAPDGVGEMLVRYDSLVAERNNLKLKIKRIGEDVEQYKAKFAQTKRELEMRCERFVLPGDVEGQIEGINEQIERAQYKYSCAKKALELLQSAKDGLTSSYLPLLNGAFVKYLATLSDGKLTTATVDSGFGIRILQEGQMVEVEYLSTGYREICNFALRLALMQCIYGKDLPFVILDDPFVNYDDNNFALAQKLLTELSATTQVIYLTCRNR